MTKHKYPKCACAHAGDGERGVPAAAGGAAHRHRVLGRAQRALRGADLPGRHVLGQVQRGRAPAASGAGDPLLLGQIIILIATDMYHQKR